MIFRSLFLIVFFISSNVIAQRQQKTDSLETELSNTVDHLQKFYILNDLWTRTINNDIDKAVDYSSQIIELGKEMKVDSILGFGYEKKGTTYAYMNKFDSSGIYFRKALKIYDDAQNFKKKAGIFRNLGQDHNMMNNLDSAFYYYDQSGKNYRKVDDSVGIAHIINSKAVVYLQKGFYNLALEKATESEKIYANLDLQQDLNQNRMIIASTYANMKDTINAIKYYKKTTEYFREQNLKRQLCVSMILLAGLQIPSQKLNPETEKLIKESLAISKSLKAPTLINNALTKYGNFLYANANYQKAKQVQRDIIADEINRNEDFDLAYSKKNLAKTLIALKDYNTAISHLKDAYKIAKRYDITSIMPDINLLLSRSYEKKGNFTNSLEYFKNYKTAYDQINDKESQNRFSELQTIYETEKKESEIALQKEEIKTLNAQAENDKLTKTIYGIGMFSFITISGLIFFGFRQRIKKNRIAREKQEAILKRDIEFKKKELATQTLHLVQKNTFIQELKENLEKIKQSPDLFKVEFRRIVMLLKKESAGEKDWEVFKSYFTEVHNNFDKKIKAACENITEKEIRLASFLRMNLTTKEIASILNVLPDSVLKSKYRLKKKLALTKNDDLQDFLNTL
ncbi:MAG: hypothetical protein GVY05_05070 [Bacteroidetes bacterium]|jgi:DNA-binding CsgD family transcriptional regulator|nr:hypothetical protein [Bacteroidota bacterium]